MVSRTAVFAVLALAAAVGVSATAPLSSFSSDAAASTGWRVLEAADASTPRTFRIALARPHADALTTLVHKISDPAHPLYKEYLSMTELAAYNSPSDAALTAVTAWLSAAGVEFELEQPSSHVVTVKTTVGKASTLFGTTFNVYANINTAQTAVVGDAVNVPADVAEHIEAVFGVHGLPLPPRRAKKLSAADETVTPSVIEAAYNVNGATGSQSQKNRQAVVEFQGQLLSQADLTTFFGEFVKNAKSGDDKVFKYVGDNQQGEGVEANLDIQYIMGVAPGILTEAWQYAGMDFCGDLKKWTSQVLSTSNPPNVFSVSYGWQGNLAEIGCSAAQVQSVDADFKAINAAGVTIIFASGDSGSGYTNGELYASWPASSYYVTAVGATRFESGNSGTEAAVEAFGSGGGFSRVITPAPAWQTEPIKTFYQNEKNAPPQSSYGYGGRGTPDVAALGMGFQVVIDGGVESVGGTSAAAPTFAGIVSLVNEKLISEGKKPLGNLNAFIYGNTDVFTDITSGSDRVSRGGIPVPLGFDCVQGWDPVTGWGTPDFQKFASKA